VVAADCRSDPSRPGLTLVAVVHTSGDGGFGAVRTLYVVEGARTRPVLSDLFTTQWRYIQEAQSRCNPNGPETEIIENFALSISLGPESHAGYRDLAISATSSRDDRHPTGRKPFRHTLRCDGRIYPTQACDQAYGAWRR
jgi:hypothetical protein